MKQRKSYIVPLAILLLMLFVSPTIVKGFHHHFPVNITLPADPHEKSITKFISACPVCQFEFVTFAAFANQEYTYYSLPSSPGCCEPTLGIKGNFFTCYSLRAPPLN